MCYEKRNPEQARACFERDQRKDDYISRKALLAEYDRVHVGPPGGARKLIEDAPAANVQTVVHGRWVGTNKGSITLWSCSECQTLGSPQWKGCPVCLARMDGAE